MYPNLNFWFENKPSGNPGTMALRFIPKVPTLIEHVIYFQVCLYFLDGCKNSQRAQNSLLPVSKTGV
jgi:hypothetical protein